MSLQFDTDVQFVKGVGPKLGETLRKRSIHQVKDLLEYYPRTYEDRRVARHIQSLVPDQLVSLKAQILKVRSMPMGKSKRRIYEVLVGDTTGRIACKYFRVPYKGYFERFQPFQEVRVIGKPSFYRGALEFHHPDIHPIKPEEEVSNALIPIYVEIEGLTSPKIARLVKSVLTEPIPEFMPQKILEKYDLMSLNQAIREVHEPPVEQGDLFIKYESAAQKRIIFDEFFLMEFHLARKRQKLEREKSQAIRSSGGLPKKLQESLEFELTGAQQRSYAEIIKDLNRAFFGLGLAGEQADS
jgi:ATP-dependent DNA helicase RecG